MLSATVPTAATRHAGVFDIEELEAVLTRLSRTTSACDEHVPHIMIQGPYTNHHVLIRQGDLQYGEGLDRTSAHEKLSVEDVCDRIVRAAQPRKQKTARIRVAKPRKPLGPSVAVIAGATILLQTILATSGYYSVVKPLDYTPLQAGPQLTSLKDKCAGVFWTPTEDTRTVLAIGDGGQAWLYEMSDTPGVSDFIPLESFHYEFAKLNGVHVLILNGIEVVEIGSSGELSMEGTVFVAAEMDAARSRTLMLGGQS